MQNSKPPCVRCKQRGLSCTLNKSLQMILDGDDAWKHAISRKVARLEQSLSRMAEHVSCPALLVRDESEDEIATMDLGALPPPAQSSTHDFAPTPPEQDEMHSHKWTVVMDDDTGPGAIPGSVISPFIAPDTKQDRVVKDVVSRGLLSIEEAQACLDVYQNRLDHFLYRILGDRRSLQEVRLSSPLLLAAVCAVGTLHGSPGDFDKCYQEFKSISAAKVFSRHSNEDDIRGLCIAAFWLSDISWPCIGNAVRIATEIGLHRSIFNALSGDRTHYLRTRLYYLVYVCDHQFSVAFGRPPLTTEDDAVKASAQFLESRHSEEDDARLVSQVQFWVVGSEVYRTFGVNVERPLDATMIEPLHRLGIKLDNIRADWTERFSQNAYVGNYPRKGVGLHYHFAKLYLYSHVFRGIGKPGFMSSGIVLDINELGHAALLSATAIIRAVTNDIEIQGYLNGLPTYFNVMIAFAVVFVLKVSAPAYSSLIHVETADVRSKISELVVVLQRITADMHPRHLLVSIARGVQVLFAKCFPPTSTEIPRPYEPGNTVLDAGDRNMYDMLGSWDATAFDEFLLGDFDFLATQEHFNGV